MIERESRERILLSYVELTNPNSFEWDFPAQDKLGPAFSKKYQLPLGLSELELAEVHLLARRENDRETILFIFEEIVRMNEELKPCYQYVVSNEHLSMIWLINGVLSRYLPEDILYFYTFQNDNTLRSPETELNCPGLVTSPKTYYRYIQTVGCTSLSEGNLKATA